MSILAKIKGALATDAKGNTTESVSTDNWRAGRVDITAGAWVLLGDGSPRNHIAIRSPSSNPSDIILAPSDTGYSNDPTNDTCGLTLEINGKESFPMTANLLIYARVVSGGSACRLSVAEAL